jgi:hypothetical protein
MAQREVRGTSGHGLSVVEAVEALRPAWVRAEQTALANEPRRSSRRARLGRQSQARRFERTNPIGNKGSLFLECQGSRVTALWCLQGPEGTLHNLWRKCGRRERGTDAQDSVGGAIRRADA